MSENIKLINTAELAKILGISKASLYNIRYRTPHQLPPSIMLGKRRLLWRQVTLDTFLKEQEQITADRMEKGQPQRFS